MLNHLKLIHSLFFLSSLFISQTTLAQELQLLTALEEDITESSGLIYLDDRLITHEDGGTSGPFILEIDPTTGETSRLVVINDANNRDWEAMCYDDEFIYIGDFGNNLGNRTDLGIYKISIDDYLNNNTVDASFISFQYSDQTEFEANSNHNFDAEAFIAYGDSLYIFTKNRLDYQTNVYAVSKTPGAYSIHKNGTLKADCLVTDATYDSQNQRLSLIGYFTVVPIFMNIENITDARFSSYDLERLELNVISGYSHQIEGLTHRENDQFYITSEKNALADQALYDLDLISSNLGVSSSNSNLIYPNPTLHQFSISGDVEYFSLFDSNGQEVIKGKQQNVYLHDFPSGCYTLKIKFANQEKLHTEQIIKL